MARPDGEPGHPANAHRDLPRTRHLHEILTDLNWRRHVAMVSWLDLAKLYRYVGR
jgi:hypothetical protein